MQEEEDASRDEEGQDGVQEEDEGEEDGDDDEGDGGKEDTEPGSISRVEVPGCLRTTNRDGSDGEVSIAREAQFTDEAPLTSHFNQGGGNETMGPEAGVEKNEGKSQTHWSETGGGRGTEPKPMSPVGQIHIACDGSNDRNQTTDGVSVTSQPNHRGESKVYDSEAGVGENADGNQPKRSEACEQERADRGSLSPVEQANAADDSSDDGAKATDGVSATSQPNQICEHEMIHSEAPVVDSEGDGQSNKSETLCRPEGAKPGPILPVEQSYVANEKSDFDAQTIDRPPLTSLPNTSNGDELSHSEAKVGERGGGSRPDGLEARCDRGAEVGSISLVGPPNATSGRFDNDAQTIDGSSVTSHSNQSRDNEVSRSQARVGEHGGGRPIGSATSEVTGGDGGPTKPVEQAIAADGGSDDDDHTADGAYMTSQPHQGGEEKGLGPEEEMAQSNGRDSEPEPMSPVKQANAADASSDGEDQATNHMCVASQTDQSGEDEVSDSEVGVGESEGAGKPNGSEAIYHRGEAEAGPMSSAERPLATSKRPDNYAQTINGPSVISQSSQSGEGELSHSIARVHESGSGSQPNGSETSEGTSQRKESVASERGPADQGPISPVEQANAPHGGSNDDAQATDGASATTEPDQGDGDEVVESEVEVLGSEGSSHRRESVASKRERAEAGPIIQVNEANTADSGCDDEVQTTDGAPTTSQSNQGGEDVALGSEAGVGESIGCSQPTALEGCCERAERDGSSDKVLTTAAGASTISRGDRNSGCEAFGPEVVGGKGGGRLTNEWVASERPENGRGNRWPIKQEHVAGDRFDDDVQATNGASVYSPANQDNEDGPLAIEAGAGESKGGIPAHPYGTADAMYAEGKAHRAPISPGEQANAVDYRFDDEAQATAGATETSQFENSDSHDEPRSQSGADPGSISPVKPANIAGNVSDDHGQITDGASETSQHNQSEGEAPGPEAGVVQYEGSSQPYKRGATRERAAAQPITISSIHQIHAGDRCDDEVQTVHDENDPPDSKTAGGFSEDEREQRKRKKNDQTVVIVTPVVPDDAATSGLTAGHDLAACNGSEVVAATVTTPTKGLSVEGSSSAGTEKGIQNIVNLAIHCEVGHHSGGKLEDERPGGEQTVGGRQNEAVGCGLRDVEVLGMNASSAEGLVKPAALIAVASPTVFYSRGESYGELGDSGSTHKLAPEQQLAGIVASNSTDSAKWTVEQPEKLEMPETKVDALFEDRPNPRKTKALADENRLSTRDSACQTTWNSEAGTQTSRCSSPTDKLPNNKSDNCCETTPSTPRFVSIGRGQQEEMQTTSAGIGGGIVSTLDINGSELPSWARRASRRVSCAFSGDNNERRSSSLCDRQGQG